MLILSSFSFNSSSNDNFPPRFLPYTSILWTIVDDNFQQLVEWLFQSDWGGEFQALHKHLLQSSIQHRLSYPHTPEQNGTAERKHCHILETALALLHPRNRLSFPLCRISFGVKLTSWIVWSLQLSIQQIPHEILFQRPPDYEFLKVFGLSVFSLTAILDPRQAHSKIWAVCPSPTLLASCHHWWVSSPLEQWYSFGSSSTSPSRPRLQMGSFAPSFISAALLTGTWIALSLWIFIKQMPSTILTPSAPLSKTTLWCSNWLDLPLERDSKVWNRERRDNEEGRVTRPLTGEGKERRAFSAEILAWSGYGHSQTRSCVIPFSTNLIESVSWKKGKERWFKLQSQKLKR